MSYKSSLETHTIDTPDRILQFSNLLDLGFHVSKGAHFFDDFPIWNPQWNCASVLRLGIFKNHQLLSAACIRIAPLQTDSTSGVSEPQPTRVALIGAVVTHPEWRNQGFASQLITDLLAWAHEKKATLALLWGSEHALYQSFGFELFGQQTRIPLSLFQESPTPPCLIQQGWHPHIFSALQTRGSGLQISPSDQKWYEAHQNVTWFYAHSADCPALIKAYAAYGRGIDLPGLVHEWGGDPIFLKAIFKKIGQLYPQAELLLSPQQASIFQMTASPALPSESLCLAKSLVHPTQSIPSFWIWGLDAV